MTYLLALFALQMAADGWTTWQVIRFGGREVIPYLKWLMDKIGVYNTLLLVKIGPWCGVAYYVWTDAMTLKTLAWVCGIYAVVVANNYTVFRKQQRLKN